RSETALAASWRIEQWSEIPEGMRIPSQQTALHPVGASVHQIHSVEDLDRMVVNVEILEFPEGSEGGVGRVIEVLGYPDDFGVDVEIIIRKHHLPHQFPAAVIEQAQEISPQISP